MKRWILSLVLGVMVGWSAGAANGESRAIALAEAALSEIKSEPCWDRANGEAWSAVVACAERYDCEKLFSEAVQSASSLLDEQGTIIGRQPASDADRYAAARFLFAAYDHTGDKRFRRAIEQLYLHYAEQGVTDTLAVTPFLAQYARRFGKRKTGDIRSTTYATISRVLQAALDADQPEQRVRALRLATEALDFLPAKEQPAKELSQRLLALLPALESSEGLYASLTALRKNHLKHDRREVIFAAAERRFLDEKSRKAVVEGITAADVAAAVAWEALTNRDCALDTTGPKAFPTAEGGGRFTTGGRGGKVLTVTKLTDDGSEGTLRWAVNQRYPRTVVFAVAGVIALEKPLKVSSGDLTLAGQSAPEGGITLCNFGVDLSADNVIIRYLRFRMGDRGGAQSDALSGKGCRRVIIDHCSMSWSTDECASFYANRDFTMQWCIISESLAASLHAKGSHGYGAIWGGRNATYHHNLLAHHTSRNPRLDHPFVYNETLRTSYRGTTEVVNNVIYNWGFKACYGGEEGWWNLVGNYFKAGPGTTKHDGVVEISINKNTGNTIGSYFLSGNHLEGDRRRTAENWLATDIAGGFTRNDADHRVLHDMPAGNYDAQPAAKAYEAVLKGAGASLRRDAVDLRIVEEVRQGTATYRGSKSGAAGLIDSQEDVGGWPSIAPATAAADSDGDGMSDVWEQSHGLDPHDGADGALTTLDDRYTNTECYLNSLTGEWSEPRK